MTALSGAKWRAGFAHHSITFAYNFKIPRAQRILGVNRTVHTAEHLASAFFASGVPIQDVPRAELSAADSPIKGQIRRPASVCLRAREAMARGALLRSGPLPEALEHRARFPCGEPEDDSSPFRAHQVFQGTLSEAKAVISKAALFIGNDSGPAHIAAAFAVPSVVFFSTSNPAIWGPWRTESEIVVAPDGLNKVSVSRVIAALERLRMFEEAHA